MSLPLGMLSRQRAQTLSWLIVKQAVEGRGMLARSDGTYLLSQHSGDRGKKIEGSRLAWATQCLKPGMMMDEYNTSTGEVKVGGSRVQG